MGGQLLAKTMRITVTAEPQPGVLAKICHVLGRAGVNFVAVCGADAAGRGRIRLVVNDPARAKEALTAAKIRGGEEPALLLLFRGVSSGVSRLVA